MVFLGAEAGRQRLPWAGLVAGSLRCVWPGVLVMWCEFRRSRLASWSSVAYFRGFSWKQLDRLTSRSAWAGHLGSDGVCCGV